MNDDTVELDDRTLKRLAFKGAEMPEGLMQANQLLYLCLRELYRQSADGVLDAATGEQEVAKLFRQRDIAVRREADNTKSLHHTAHLWRDIERSSTSFCKARKEGNDAEALRFADAMYKVIYHMDAVPPVYND